MYVLYILFWYKVLLWSKNVARNGMQYHWFSMIFCAVYIIRYRDRKYKRNGSRNMLYIKCLAKNLQDTLYINLCLILLFGFRCLKYVFKYLYCSCHFSVTAFIISLMVSPSRSLRSPGYSRLTGYRIPAGMLQ